MGSIKTLLKIDYLKKSLLTHLSYNLQGCFRLGPGANRLRWLLLTIVICRATSPETINLILQDPQGVWPFLKHLMHDSSQTALELSDSVQFSPVTRSDYILFPSSGCWLGVHYDAWTVITHPICRQTDALTVQPVAHDRSPRNQSTYETIGT